MQVPGRGFPRRTAVGAAALLLAGMLAGCATGDVTSRIVADVYEQVVRCDADGACVVVSTDVPVAGERLDVVGIVSSGASVHDPGLYVYAGGFRGSGIFFELELDVPAYVGAETRELIAAYREYLAGRTVFHSTRVGGEIQVVPLAGDDGPYAGTFDLLFTDPGRDGTLDTPDDLVRTLRFGSFTLSGKEPEDRPRPEYTWNDQVLVDVEVDIWLDDPAWDYQAEGCGSDVPEGYDEGSGCEGDTSTDPGGGAGCEGDTTGDVGGGEGCEGDTAGDFGGGEGCSGDTGGGASGCGGDTGGGCSGADAPDGPTARRPSRARPNRILSSSLPLLALLAVRRLLRRR